MSDIVIVTPGALGSNPRVVKEADALSAAGLGVRVISTRTLDAVDLRDDAILRTTKWASVRIDLRKRSSWRRRRAVQLAARLGYEKFGISRAVETAHSPFVRALKRAADKVPPAKLYIAHYVAALPAVARAAAHHRVAYAFDAEDFHLGDLPDKPEHQLGKHLFRAIEARYLPGAAYVTAASPLIADAYAQTYNIPRPFVVLNVFPKKNAPPSPTACGTVQPGPSLYWFSQTIGPGRGIETAIEAIARAKSLPHLYLRGTPASGYAEYLQRVSDRSGIARRVHLLNPIDPDELEHAGANFDLGYSGEPGLSGNRLRALGNKLFSYLLSGLPSLATDIPAHRQIATELGEAMTLFPIGDADALATAIDRLLLDPARLAAARAHAWQVGQSRFNWEANMAQVVEPARRILEC